MTGILPTTILKYSCCPADRSSAMRFDHQAGNTPPAILRDAEGRTAKRDETTNGDPCAMQAARSRGVEPMNRLEPGHIRASGYTE